MADDTQNTPLFGQPAVSPETLRGRRAVNQALLAQGLDSSPIRSPWQGAARLAETLVGALGQGRLDKSELEARQKLTQDTIDFWNGGDPSRLLANPYTTPEALRLAIEGRKQHMLDVGTGYTPTNQFTGAQTNATIPKNNLGTMQTPAGSMPTVIPGAPYNPPFRGAAPPPTPGMQSAPMAPARPAAPPVPDDMRPNRTFDERFSPTGVTSSGAGTVIPESFRRFAQEAADIEAKRIGTTTEATSNAALLAQHREAGLEAKQQVADLDTLQQLGRRAGYGLSAELKTFIGNRTGIDMGNLTENQAYKMFLDRYAPLLRPEGSGGLKTAELAGFTNSLGGLSTTKEGRELAVASIGKIANYKIRAGEIASGSGTDAQKLDAIRKLELPQIDFDRIKSLTKEREAAPANFTVKHPDGREYYKDPQTGSWWRK